MITRRRSTLCWETACFIAGLVLVRATISFCAPPMTSQPATQALDVVRAYLKAVHARDFRSAYQLIAAADRRIRDKKTYVESQESLDGFALELSRTLAADLKVRIIEQSVTSDRATLEVAYHVPTGDELAARLFDWNAKKLNGLPPSAQQRLAVELDNLKQGRQMIRLEGRETFHLVREESGWRIFLDWASRARVVFKSVVARAEALEVHFTRNDFLVEMNQPFQVDFTLKNRSARPIVARLNHVIEPRRFAENVEMVACGSLAPVRLDPGETRVASSSYILGGVAAKSRLWIVYEFTVVPPRPEPKSIFGARPQPSR